MIMCSFTHVCVSTPTEAIKSLVQPMRFWSFIAIFYCKSYIDFLCLVYGRSASIYMAENKRIPRVQEIMNAMIPTKGVISMHSN